MCNVHERITDKNGLKIPIITFGLKWGAILKALYKC